MTELETAYKRLFATEDGKKVMADLESYCGFKSPSVDERNPETLSTFFKEGKRRVFLRIIGMMEKETK